MFTRPLLLALSGVLLAAALSLAVFFVSEAALGTDSSPLEPREPVFVASTDGAPAEPELEPATTTDHTDTNPLDLVPVVTDDGDEPEDDRGRGRGRGRSGGHSGGSGTDSSGSGSSGSSGSGSSGSGSSGSGSSGSSGKGSDDD